MKTHANDRDMYLHLGRVPNITIYLPSTATDVQFIKKYDDG